MTTFLMCPRCSRKRVRIIKEFGAAGTLECDWCYLAGFDMAEMERKAKEKPVTQYMLDKGWKPSQLTT